jgi:hypothetical protein
LDEQEKPKTFTDHLPLFKRAPRLIWRPNSKQEEIVKREQQSEYPIFAADFALLEQHLMPDFRKLDNDAMLKQNQFRRAQVILIGGGVVVTVLGALQVSHIGGLWIGVIEAVVAILLAMVAQGARTNKAQELYFRNRLKAETLRSEYFTFLRHAHPYEHDLTRGQHLRQRVLRIKTSNDRPTPSDESDLTDADQQAKSEMDKRDEQFWAFYQRYRFIDQLNFYEGRREEFEKAQTQATNFHSGLMALASIVSVVGTANLVKNDGFSIVCAILAVGFPGLATAFTTYANLYAFERTAKLYGDAAEGLRFVDVYFAPGTSPQATLDGFVKKVEAIFTAEQKQWGQLVSEIEGASPPGGAPN